MIPWIPGAKSADLVGHGGPRGVNDSLYIGFSIIHGREIRLASCWYVYDVYANPPENKNSIFWNRPIRISSIFIFRIVIVRRSFRTKEGYFFNPALTLQTTSWQKCARERSAAFALLKKRIGDEKKVSMLRFQRKTLLDQFYATIVANGLISPFSRGIFRCKRAPITLALLTGKKNSRRVKRITSSSIPREEHPFPEALSYPWMGARGRKPDQRRERGAHCRHASFPWCAFRSSVASVACCSISTSHCADASKPPSPPPGYIRVYKRSGAARGGCLPPDRVGIVHGLILM